MELEASKGKVHITKAEGSESWKLYSALLKECLKEDIKLTDVFNELFSKLKEGDVQKFLQEEIPVELIDKLLQIFMVIGSSDEIRRLFLECAKKSFYTFEDGSQEGINEALLNKMPEDYNLIFFACLKENVLPFFLGIKGLLSNLFSSKT